MLDDGQVVGDEQVGQAEPGLQIGEQLMIWAWMDTSRADTGSSQTIRLGSTARARAIPIRWHWPPLNSCGKRDTDIGREPDQGQQFLHSGAPLVPGHQVVDPEGLTDQLAHGVARVQGGDGVLEDDLNVPAQVGEGAVVELGQVQALEADGAAGGPVEEQDGAAGGRLRAPALSDQAQRLGLSSVKLTPSTACTVSRVRKTVPAPRM